MVGGTAVSIGTKVGKGVGEAGAGFRMRKTSVTRCPVAGSMTVISARGISAQRGSNGYVKRTTKSPRSVTMAEA